MNFITKYISVLCFLFAFSAFSQALIKGKVVDNYGPITGADIYLKNTSFGTQTNQNGLYELQVPEGQHILVISYTGFKTIETNINSKAKQTLTKNFTIEPETNSLSNVEVFAKTEADIIKEKAFEVEVIETKELKNSAIDVNSVLKKIPGVNIRQSGGLGSNFNFSLNGLSGRKVKFFIDGISIDSYGSSLTLNNFPASLIERVEIYKGVSPIYLGADALGGAINIITNQSTDGLIDATYSYGSFNTHQASLDIQQKFAKNWIFKLSSFYNYSDNNYTVDDIQLYENFNEAGIVNNIERFHDAYASQMIDVKAGVINRKFADQFLLGFSTSSNKNEIQHSEVSMLVPYGEVFTKNDTYKFGMYYTKDNLLNKKLKAKFVATIGENKEIQVDTSSKRYDWFGIANDRISNGDDLGEQGFDKTLFTFKDNIHFINLSTDYEITKNNSLSFNYTKDYIMRIGSDPFSPLLTSPFETPHILDKNILGLSYNLNLFEKKWTTNIFTKQFFSHLDGILEDLFAETQTPYTRNSTNTGYGIATTFKINNSLRLKTSFERTYRIPDGYELFGNGLTIRPNIELEPENSYNVNLGSIYNLNFSNSIGISLDANLFFRDSNNFILPVSEAIFVRYYNLKDVRSYGAETEITFKYKSNFLLSLNGTYQELRDLNLENSRVANRPYLFGNLNIGYNFHKLLSTTDKLSLSWNSSFVEEFPFQSYTEGNEEDRIYVPQQLSHNIELAYSLNQGKYNFSFLTKNLSDNKLYDNFSIQQPGRAFYFKVRYNINN